MSRPEVAVSDSSVKITVPTGWSATFSAITRKGYNQLVTCEYTILGDIETHLIANKWQEPNQTMRDIDSTSDQLALIPQDENNVLNLNFYYSKQGPIRGAQLRNDKYRSSRVNALVSSKPVNAPKEFPDYVTFILLVEDGPESEQIAGQPQFDDIVATVHVLKGVQQSPPVVVPKFNFPNIQGDVLPGLPKALEYFYYFQITDLPRFRATFGKFIVPRITTADDVINRPPPPPPNPAVQFLGVNVGFSHLALKLFGLTDDLRDDSFEKGQQQDAKSLGDAGTQRGQFWTPNWDPEYKVDLHGIFLITAYNEERATTFIKELETAFATAPRRSSIKKIVVVHGYPRADPEARNDHFGYRGGMSNPQVRGYTFFGEKPRYPGSPIIDLGIIVMGYDGDEDKDKRPSWAKDGSFLVTRKLNNLVPEFDQFLLEHGPRIFPNISPQDAADRLGARLFGRWKNGTPVELSPDNNDPSIAKDDNRINDFVFDQSKGQSSCPFASHMRKSNPRNDVAPVESAFRHFIRRHNMPYGNEVQDDERDGRGTIEDRGLQLICYQSSIVRGFKFIQQGWYNDPDFPPNKSIQPGHDPIFGQTGREDQGDHRSMSGANPSAEAELMKFPHKFIDPRGGEYFFSPSISTLRDIIAA